MPILIRGMSKCPLCKKVIETGQDVVSFQQVFHDLTNPLSNFGGKTMHRACFLKSPESSKFLEFYQKVENGYDKKISLVTNKSLLEIEDLHPDNAIYMGLLTEDANSELYKYNFLWVNLEEFSVWSERNRFTRLLKIEGMKPGRKSFLEMSNRLESSPKPRLSREIIERYKQRDN